MHTHSDMITLPGPLKWSENCSVLRWSLQIGHMSNHKQFSVLTGEPGPVGVSTPKYRTAGANESE